MFFYMPLTNFHYIQLFGLLLLHLSRDRYIFKKLPSSSPYAI